MVVLHGDGSLGLVQEDLALPRAACRGSHGAHGLLSEAGGRVLGEVLQ